MNNFFNPSTVAIVGASRDPKKLGHIVLENMLIDFKGDVYPINPKAEFILGKKCYKSLLDVKGNIDLAIIITPANNVYDIIQQCSKKEISSVIILSAGFSEIGNVKEEEKIRNFSKKMRILGPNCIGIYNADSGLDTLFTKIHRQERPKKGSISFVSQSGAFGVAMMDIAASEHIKMSKFISIGNRIDIDEIDLLNYLEKDKETKTIAMYIEGAKNGLDFIKTLKKIKKPLIVLKSGKTSEAAHAIQSHTASLAGQAEIYSSLFKQSGIIEAENIDELFDFSKALDLQPLPKGKKIQIITNGGGFGIIATDAITNQGLQLSKLSESSKSKIKKSVPNYISINNPLDLTGDADSQRYKLSIETAMKDKNVDAILLIVLFQLSTLDSTMIKIISDSKKYKKPIVLCSLGGEFTDIYKKILEESGIPTYPTPDRAAAALAALVKRSEYIKLKKKK
ncbi:MAG: CoA-binding protein [Candidatus Aenigmarchaeota archaeon]|nr:CoA-binding protein [Candidatus Aenigmarchaeota archaeon]